MALDFAKSQGIEYFEVSCFSGQNLRACFGELMTQVYNKQIDYYQNLEVLCGTYIDNNYLSTTVDKVDDDWVLC